MQVVEANKSERRKAAGEAELLLQEEQLAFEAWRDSLETVPTIKALRSKAESIRASELDRTLAKLGDGLTKKQVRSHTAADGGRAAKPCPESCGVLAQQHTQQLPSGKLSSRLLQCACSAAHRASALGS